MNLSRLSTRRLVALFVVLWTLAATLAVVLAGHLYGDPGAPTTLAHVLVNFAAIAIVSFIGWQLLGRQLLSREVDSRALPDRPEFFDYDLLNLPRHLQEMDGRRLKDLDYTVFDTETTGLRPSKGDEIISIGAVGVHGSAVSQDRVFDQLVNPGRDIPKASTRIHGITDEMVKDVPAITVSLPAFRDFVGDTVMVAHSASFDMKFLKLKETETGVAFDHVVLDTLLISVFLDRDTDAHSLEAIAKRYGVTIEGRHSALGDAQATAEIFAAMLQKLQARGITTLDQLIRACNEMVAVRKLDQQY